MADDVLPESRLIHDPTNGSVMADWVTPSGKTVRIECVRVYCANCGVHHGYVPRENTTWAFWLCQKCYEKYGVPASLMVQPDDEFWQNVHAEMIAQFGHVLSQAELERLAEVDLGPLLSKLMKESPLFKPR